MWPGTDSFYKTDNDSLTEVEIVFRFLMDTYFVGSSFISNNFFLLDPWSR